jgi:hypothetical protein
MQNAKCKIENQAVKLSRLFFAFCILHFAFAAQAVDVESMMAGSVLNGPAGVR